MAPEVLNNRPYDSKADVWSLGAMFYEMITGFVPFTGRSEAELINNVELGTYMVPKDVHLSLEGLSFLNECLQYDATKRTSLDDLIKHDYLKKELVAQGGGIQLSFRKYGHTFSHAS